MRKLLCGLIAATLLAGQAHANWTGKDATPATITFYNPGACTSVVCVPVVQLTDGTNQVTLTTAGADAVSNTLTGLPVYARMLQYNGTTWDRWQGAISIASGKVASGAFASGSIASGAVASGAYAAGSLAAGAGVDGWDLTQGAIADAAVTAGATGSVSAKLRSISRDVAGLNLAQGSTTAGQVGNLVQCAVTTSAPTYTTATTNPINCDTAGNQRVTVTNANANGQATAANSSPVVLPATQVTADVCSLNAKTNLPISQNGTSSVQLVALSGSTVIYVCSLSLIAAGATTVALTTGTGTACVTGNAAVIGTTTASIANSMSLAANGGLTLGNGAGTIAKGAAASELCMVLGSNVFVSGNLTYVQQ